MARFDRDEVVAHHRRLIRAPNLVLAVAGDVEPDTLAARVFEEECVALPEALKLCIEGRVRVSGNRVTLTTETPPELQTDP